MRRLIARLAVSALLCGWALSACGVTTQSRPEPIGVPAPSQGPTTEAGVPGTGATLYFLRRGRLEAVHRSTPSPGLRSALDMLTAGPSEEEAAGGLRTALAPQRLTATTGGSDCRTVVVEVTRDFTSLPGRSQLLAVAQVVWTVTELPGCDRVRFQDGGRPLETPTDHGLTDQPVTRADYLSATVAGGTATASGTGPPAPPPGTSGTSAPGTG
jgi:spore germination protein GerM